MTQSSLKRGVQKRAVLQALFLVSDAGLQKNKNCLKKREICLSKSKSSSSKSRFASQAAWYRMENGLKSKNGKKLAKNRKWPMARNGGKMAQKWPKNGIWGHFSIFWPYLGHFFPISGQGSFFFLPIFFPIFGFQPVFHSIPGGLTRKSRLIALPE